MSTVPGSSMRFLEKSRGLTVDTVAYDLEDSVTPGKKAEARSNLRKFLSRERVQGVKEQAVRINAVDSGYALEDLTEVVRRLVSSIEIVSRGERYRRSFLI